MPAHKFTQYIRERLKTEGNSTEYLELECQNINFSAEHELEAKKRLIDPYYTIAELLKFYGLSQQAGKEEL